MKSAYLTRKMSITPLLHDFNVIKLPQIQYLLFSYFTTANVSSKMLFFIKKQGFTSFSIIDEYYLFIQSYFIQM